MATLANITNTVTEKADMDTPSKVLGENSGVVKMNLQVSEFKRKEQAGELKAEPLLTENPGRFVLFPIQYPKIWEANTTSSV